MGLWLAKPGGSSWAPWIVTSLGRIQQLDRMGKATLGSPGCLPACRGWDRLGWGWRLSPGSWSGWDAICIPALPLCSLGCCLAFGGLLELLAPREVP